MNKSNHRVMALRSDLLIYLSEDLHWLDIIGGALAKFRILSEEPILNFTELSAFSSPEWHIVMVINSKCEWSIYQVSSHQQPIQLHHGQILTQETASITSIHAVSIQSKILLILSNFQMFAVEPKITKANSSWKGKSKWVETKIFKGSELSLQTHKYLARQWLPSAETSKIMCCFYNQHDALKGTLFVACSNSNSSFSIYPLQINQQNHELLSGPETLCNLSLIIEMFSFGTNKQFLLIQTQTQIVLWKVSCISPKESWVKHYDQKFNGRLTSSKMTNAWYGCKIIENINKCFKISQYASELKFEEIQLKMPQLKMIEIYFNEKQPFQSYGLSSKCELIILSKPQQPLTQNYRVSITNAYLHTSLTSNWMLVKKKIGEDEQILIQTCHWVALQTESYQHGLMLQMSKLCSTSFSFKNQCQIYLTNALIGTSCLRFAKQSVKQSCQIDIKMHKDKQARWESKEESLFLNESWQITPFNILQLSTQKSIDVESIFESGTQFITCGVVLNTSDYIVVSIGSQLHLIDGKTLKRKHILCMEAEIQSIIAVNDVNMLALTFFPSFQHQSSNPTNSYKLIRIKSDTMYEEKDINLENNKFKANSLFFDLTINTCKYKVWMIGSFVLFCSNDQLERYNNKTVYFSFTFPTPISNDSISAFQILPTTSCFLNSKNTQIQFVFIAYQNQTEVNQMKNQCQVFFLTLNRNHLLKEVTQQSLAQIVFQFEQIVALHQLSADRFLTAILFDQQKNGNERNLVLFGEKTATLITMTIGPISLKRVEDSKWLLKQCEKIILPYKGYSELLCQAKLGMKEPIHMVGTSSPHAVLLYNLTDIYLASLDPYLKSCTKLSYYCLLNDEFTVFRNNLNLEEINNPSYLNLFSQKMIIKQVKYLSNSQILVLFENSIIVLEVGYNNALVVKQELKFDKIEGQNNEVIKIIQIMQTYDHQGGIFVKDQLSRLFVLKKNSQGNLYFLFHSFLDEDISCFGRVLHWGSKGREFGLDGKKFANSDIYEELILKKDGQLIIRNTQKETEGKSIYL